MLIEKLTEKLSKLNLIVVNDEKRTRVMSQGIYLLFAIIAAGMSILNIFTQDYPLCAATAIFTVLCLIDLVIIWRSPKRQKLSENLFIVELLILFTFFIATGGTDNFSIVWVLLLPTLGLFFFGRIRGTIVSAATLVIMLLCFYSPAIQGFCTDYGQTFETRFPIVYVSCFLVSYLLEYVRFATARELDRMNANYQNLYTHDALTGAKNRYNFHETFDEICRQSSGNVAIAMFDIDHFKKFNDTHGHRFGDAVLKQLAHSVQGLLPENASLHRWGGEEFLIILPSGEDAPQFCDSIRDAISHTEFSYEGAEEHVTISVGVAICSVPDDPKSQVNSVINEADRNLYEAKNTGRNRCVCSRLS